jgi:hypothetical protein
MNAVWMNDKKGDSITLFSLEGNDEGGAGTWWKIGKISNISGVEARESAFTFNSYRDNGWIEEMDRQLNTIPRGENNQGLINILRTEENYGTFFNIKFRPQDIELSEEPQLVTDNGTLNSLRRRTYYNVLYNINDDLEGRVAEQLQNPTPFQGNPAPQEGGPQEGNSQEGGQGRLYRRKKNSKVHVKMQKAIWAQLNDIYQGQVWYEMAIETYCSVDIAVQLDGGCEIFYEIKTNNTVKECIREAFGQIMEYAYYPAENHEVYERATGLVIVSQNPINDSAKRYIDMLNEKFNLPIFYQQFVLGDNELRDAYPENPLEIACD